MSPRPAVQESRSLQRDRILEAFETRARADGPRAVVMAELARDLGISTRTLYQHFGSKAELVEEVLGRWAAEMDADQAERLQSAGSVEARMIEAATGWIEGQDRFSEAFWQQVSADFPEATRVLSDQVRKSLGVAREQVARELHHGLDVDLALSLLKGAIRHALDPHRCDRLGISRQEAVRQSVELWCRGALGPRGASD
ncbi:MAG TPA: TetR/AcrR family transcriptional regulator [Myxococcota bacterium]|nr:TetR/AcrR family transcriptional regulator [Myxococcota bacterium]